jgi:hypothetical protein
MFMIAAMITLARNLTMITIVIQARKQSSDAAIASALSCIREFNRVPALERHRVTPTHSSTLSFNVISAMILGSRREHIFDDAVERQLLMQQSLMTAYLAHNTSRCW